VSSVLLKKVKEIFYMKALIKTLLVTFSLVILVSCVPATQTVENDPPAYAGVIFTVTDVLPTSWQEEQFTQGQLFVTIFNATLYETRILDGVEFERHHNGNWISQSGSVSDGHPMTLAPGETREVIFNWGVPETPGEYRLVQNIINAGRTQRAYANFAIPNPNIPVDKVGAFIDVYATTPTSATFKITNGFASGSIYIDGFYSILHNGEEVPQIAAFESTNNKHEPFDPRREVTYIVGAQQIQHVTLHWGWLYGEIPPGEYTIWKTIRHEVYEGDDMWRGTLMDIPVHFTVKEGRYAPNADPNMMFPEEITFRAEVIQTHFDHDWWLGPSLLVECEDGWRYHVGSPAGAVLNTNGVPVPFVTIRPGMILEITHGGMILTSDPAIVSYTIQIRIYCKQP